MKKLLIATSLLALSTTAFSAVTGTLLLQGTVAKKVSIVVTPETVASALDLEVTQTDLKVATVNEKSNSNTGYKVTLLSANLGKLKRASGSEVFSYSLKYGTTAVNLSAAAGAIVTTSTASSAVNVNKDISISYTGIAAETMVEGTYADTLTINIASN